VRTQIPSADLLGRAPAPVRLTVLSGPSGVGKSTVVATLRRSYPDVWPSVSVTTRAPRPGEVDGTEYHFITDSEFEQMVANDELLEWATFAGQKYGTPKRPLIEKLREGVPAGALLVFLAPPSWDELVRRLTGRRTERPEDVARRLEAARTELAAEPEFDVTLVNTSVQEVCRELVALMMAPAGQ
jgi:guanylate kinase